MTQPKTQNPQNIAIIGAGIMGLMNAYTLKQAGHTVTLYDKPAKNNTPFDNASYNAAGMLAPYSEIEHMPPAFIEAGLAGINIWSKMAKSLPKGMEFSQNGSLILTHTEDRHVMDRFAGHLKNYEDCHPVSAEEIAALEPALPQSFEHGLILENEAHLNPRNTMEILQIQVGIKHQHVKNLKSFYGAHDLVIDCRGMEAAKDEPDLRGVKGEILIVENPEFTLSRPVRLMHPRYPLYIVPRANNVFAIGATNIEAADDKRPSLRSAMELMSALYSLHSSFGEAKIIEICADIRPAYPDNLPRITMGDHYIRCNGLYRHGFLLSPVMAEAVRAIIDRQDYEFISLFTDRTQEDPHHEAHH